MTHSRLLRTISGNTGSGNTGTADDDLTAAELLDNAEAEANKHSAYELVHETDESQRRILAIIVDNEPGILARIVGLFTGRGYNIDSLTVAPVNESLSLSRMTVVTSGTPRVVRQICDQVNRLVPCIRSMT